MSNTNSLTYCLVVTGPAYGTQQAASAYQFAKALLEEGHILKTLFFIVKVFSMRISLPRRQQMNSI
ncbi:sulfur transfer complex subunit TusD [Providencia rettgeri Dmel1]|nr:sulfur transfer complex subunit TusD [Providencia rettgeri Dmel1]